MNVERGKVQLTGKIVDADLNDLRHRFSLNSFVENSVLAKREAMFLPGVSGGEEEAVEAKAHSVVRERGCEGAAALGRGAEHPNESYNGNLLSLKVNFNAVFSGEELVAMKLLQHPRVGVD